MPKSNPTPSDRPEERPPVDPDLLADYAEQEGFREFLDEWEARKAGGGEPVPFNGTGARPPVSHVGPVKVLEVPIPGEEKARRYTLVDIDRDVIAHLSMLTTLADTDMDKAQALFEAMLLPADYVRLRRDVKLAARRLREISIEAAERGEAVEVPSIEELWRGVADAVSAPLKELNEDPKRAALLRGPSPTGPSSKNASTPEALPSVN